MRIIPQETCALLIDVQERLFPHIFERVALEGNVPILIEGLKVLDIPLLVTQQYTKGLGQTIPVIQDAPGVDQGRGACRRLTTGRRTARPPSVYRKNRLQLLGRTEVSQRSQCARTKAGITCGNRNPRLCTADRRRPAGSRLYPRGCPGLHLLPPGNGQTDRSTQTPGRRHPDHKLRIDPLRVVAGSRNRNFPSHFAAGYRTASLEPTVLRRPPIPTKEPRRLPGRCSCAS